MLLKLRPHVTPAADDATRQYSREDLYMNAFLVTYAQSDFGFKPEDPENFEKYHKLAAVLQEWHSPIQNTPERINAWNVFFNDTRQVETSLREFQTPLKAWTWAVRSLPVKYFSDVVSSLKTDGLLNELIAANKQNLDYVKTIQNFYIDRTRGIPALSPVAQIAHIDELYSYAVEFLRNLDASVAKQYGGFDAMPMRVFDATRVDDYLISALIKMSAIYYVKAVAIAFLIDHPSDLVTGGEGGRLLSYFLALVDSDQLENAFNNNLSFLLSNTAHHCGLVGYLSRDVAYMNQGLPDANQPPRQKKRQYFIEKRRTSRFPPDTPSGLARRFLQPFGLGELTEFEELGIVAAMRLCPGMFSVNVEHFDATPFFYGCPRVRVLLEHRQRFDVPRSVFCMNGQLNLKVDAMDMKGMRPFSRVKESLSLGLRQAVRFGLSIETTTTTPLQLQKYPAKDASGRASKDSSDMMAIDSTEEVDSNQDLPGVYLSDVDEQDSEDFLDMEGQEYDEDMF